MNVEQIDSKADSKATRKVRLTQYRKNAGRWQFFAVARNEDGKPNPEKIIIARKQVNWQSPGAKFYLDWFDPESGKRKREKASGGPREARVPTAFPPGIRWCSVRLPKRSSSLCNVRSCFSAQPSLREA